MKTYCLIKDGKVENVALFESEMPEGWAEPGTLWVADDTAQIGWSYDGARFSTPPSAAPIVELTAEAAKGLVISAIDAATAPIINAYPLTERLGWDTKAAEGRAVLAAGDGATLRLAPLLVAECVAEYGEASDGERLDQLVAKARIVSAKATAWGQLMATLSGLRIRTFAAIDAADDAAGIQEAIDDALAEISEGQLDGVGQATPEQPD